MHDRRRRNRRRTPKWPLWLSLGMLFLAILRLVFLFGREGTPYEHQIPAETPELGMMAPREIARKDLQQTVALYDVKAGAVRQVPLETYLVGVVAAEMPVEFEMEALKAQAVAARTYTLKHMRKWGGGGCALSSQADLCTDSTHCQAYASDEELRAKWKEAYGPNHERMRAAVEGTMGQAVLYQGQPIEALFHSTSGGHTENVEQVFSVQLPYLRGVASPGEEPSPKFQSSSAVSRKQLEKAFPDAGISKEPLKTQIEVLERTENGRVSQIRVGKQQMRGLDFRLQLGLYSSKFEMEFEEDTVLFQVTGYGHGVGMSQYGANAMAGRGETYDRILEWYFTDTTVDVPDGL